ncbi:hypothetical protein AOLI_G00190460 [Acnodon oligacanthus]
MALFEPPGGLCGVHSTQRRSDSRRWPPACAPLRAASLTAQPGRSASGVCAEGGTGGKEEEGGRKLSPFNELLSSSSSSSIPFSRSAGPGLGSHASRSRLPVSAPVFLQDSPSLHRCS